MRLNRLLPLSFALLFGLNLSAQERMTPELLWKLGRIGNVVLSPDGKQIAYTVRSYQLVENKGATSIYVIDVMSGETSEVASALVGAGDLQWLKQADSALLAFAGTTESGQTSQVWTIPAAGGEPRKVTDVEGGISNLKVSPTGTHLAFTVDVKMDREVNEIYEDLPKADARIIDSLMYRHWNAWHDYAYSHIHVATLNPDGSAKPPVDLMKGLKADCPLPPFGGAEQFAWAPDGREIAYTAKIVNNWAESTDSAIYLVPADGSKSARNITVGMNGYDTDPVYSPNGRYLAFHSMDRAGFEADRNRIMLFDRSDETIRELTVGLDQTAHAATWNGDSTGLYFGSEYRGTDQVFYVSLEANGAKQVSRGRRSWHHVGLIPDSNQMVATYTTMERPTEIALLDVESGESKTISGVNDEIYAKLELPKVEERWVRASDGKKIHNWVIYPPGFDPSKKWPLIVYCQGGPQGQIGQWFSYRWNFHLMASQGYVVLAVNRRGLPGFGREWNDQISRDWGGQAMQDILAATDDMMTEPYIDAKRVGAVGASFGGYTVYWLMGNHADRFCTMIAHCGVFNLESMYGSTEELFFVNWDMGGPYWKSSDIQNDYDRFSPHRFVGNWKTPLLVVHGQKDFRVPVTQGMEAFSAAQVQGVTSRFLYFPNEGHWVQGPQNGVLWHRVFFDWLGRSMQD